MISGPKISIIVPVYNVAPYLARCLDSLINQTLKDIEIICIDDKSTDNSLEILREYEQKDKRIRIIALDKNSGVSAARNAGIAAAHGEYLGFVDSDDYVDLDFYAKLYAKAIESGADVTVGNIRETLFNGRQLDFTDWQLNIAKSKFCFNFSQWCAIYKSNFVKNNNIQNPENLISCEDTVFVLKCAVLAKKIVIVPDAFYHYIRVSGSLSSKYLSDEKIEHRITAANMILDFLNEQNLSAQDYYNTFLEMFRFISKYCFYRTTKHETRMRLMHATLELFAKYKHKNILQKYEAEIYPYLVCNDANGLYNHIQNETRSAITKIKLFNCIPLIRIKRYDMRRIKISLFGIPVLFVKFPHKNEGIQYNG